MNSLAVRRNISDLKFVYKLINKLLLNCYVSQCQTRSTDTFYTVKLHKTNYLVNDPVNRIMRLVIMILKSIFLTLTQLNMFIIILLNIMCNL